MTCVTVSCIKKKMLDSNSTLIIDVQVIKLGKMLAKHGLHE